MLSIDLNADLGEGCPWDEELLDRVTSASICCGAHAGDDVTILNTLRFAVQKRVVIGAHPGFPDRDSFGRKECTASRAEVATLVGEQLAHLDSLAAIERATIRFVKPHGALYNQAQRDLEIARGIIDAVQGFSTEPLSLLGLPGSLLAALATKADVPYVAEGFADRGYLPDGHLIPRGQPGAILEDPKQIEAQAVQLVRSGRIQTLCLHGDDPRSVSLALLVRESLSREGVRISGFLS